MFVSPSFLPHLPPFSLFFFKDPPPPEIYTLSLHDALPILASSDAASDAKSGPAGPSTVRASLALALVASVEDRKSTRLNSSHVEISYAVFCLKKKKKSLSSNYDRSRHDKRK